MFVWKLSHQNLNYSSVPMGHLSSFVVGWKRWCLFHTVLTDSEMLLFNRWSEVTQSCPTLCDPMDCSLPRSSVHGIFQARILEWGAISFSRRSSPPRDPTQVSHTVDTHFTIWATREVNVTYVESKTWYTQIYIQNRLTNIETKLLVTKEERGKGIN